MWFFSFITMLIPCYYCVDSVFTGPYQKPSVCPGRGWDNTRWNLKEFKMRSTPLKRVLQQLCVCVFASLAYVWHPEFCFRVPVERKHSHNPAGIQDWWSAEAAARVFFCIIFKHFFWECGGLFWRLERYLCCWQFVLVFPTFSLRKHWAAGWSRRPGAVKKTFL